MFVGYIVVRSLLRVGMVKICGPVPPGLLKYICAGEFANVVVYVVGRWGAVLRWNCSEWGMYLSIEEG